ncbi:MAG: 50S ribosomal protein L35 [Candidatus Omnitrophica bacterium]|nr:50S ribosomal protein L35 [Candidatus Omnitrophota bacterium]MCM8800098.1 50S ribosomal protein L35 [Candidatus Omnitrophota bacterium]
MSLKTSKSIAKRFKFTTTGKIKYYSAGKSHLLSKKSSKRKRFLRKEDFLKSKKVKRTIRRLLPYG